MSEIDALLTRLASADSAAAEGALARLAIHGARVVEPLLVAYPMSPPSGQMRMLRLLERVPDSRTVRFLSQVAADGAPSHRRLAVRALGALPPDRGAASLIAALEVESDPAVRAEVVGLVARLSREAAPEYLDRALDILFDKAEPVPVRRAALVSLAGLRPRPARRLLERLAGDKGDPLSVECAAALRRSPEDPRRELPQLTTAVPMEPAPEPERTAASGLVDIPVVLSRLDAGGEQAADDGTARALDALSPEARRDLADRLDPDWPLAMVERALGAIRSCHDSRSLGALVRLARGLGRRCRTEPDPELREMLAGCRARIHRMLAEAGSRLGIADLKDALRESEPPPPDLIGALSAIGRAEDLADLLAAHPRADSWLRAEIEAAAMRILKREGPRRTRRALSALPPRQSEILQPFLDRTRPGRLLPGSAPSSGESR